MMNPLALVLALGLGLGPVAAPDSSSLPVAPSETAVVSRVIDGDTFDASGERVRVLGIDSCEHGTAGGAAATARARALLPTGQAVTLRAQPGVDRDRYGRELRYVSLGTGRDYGAVMVAAPHTAVYAGRNDAAPDYVALLRAIDTNGRSC